MQTPHDGDYRDIIDERQKKVSSQRSQEAADKLWENSTEALDKERNIKYIGAKKKQIACLNGLGLRKVNSFSVLENTPEVRGMISKVNHLVQIETVV